MENHEKTTPFLCDFAIKQVHESTVLLTVRPDPGTESSLSGYDTVIRILKVYQKNKPEFSVLRQKQAQLLPLMVALISDDTLRGEIAILEQ